MGYTPSHLGHVNIYVRNAEASRQWYEDVLGLHTYDFVAGRAAFMSANLDESHEIALMEVGANADGPQQGQVGLNHMAWRFDTLADLEAFYNNIHAKKVPIKHITNHGLSLGIYFQDPDGNGIECYYEAPRSEWFRQEKLFMHPDRPSMDFPGPWEKELREQELAAKS